MHARTGRHVRQQRGRAACRSDAASMSSSGPATAHRIAWPAISARTRKIRKITSAMPKRTRAIVAVAAETPEKPKKPAMIEITKNIRAHFSMTSSFAFAWERRSNRENVPDRWNGMAISLEKRGGEMRVFPKTVRSVSRNDRFAPSMKAPSSCQLFWTSIQSPLISKSS